MTVNRFTGEMESGGYMTQSIQDTLAERGSRYGLFAVHAEYAEGLNQVFESAPNWKRMKPDAKEALRIIANKIGRILNGDPDYDDSWHDIAGYATLVENRIHREQADAVKAVVVPGRLP